MPAHPSEVTGNRIGVMSDRKGQLIPWKFQIDGRVVTYSPDSSVILNNLDAALDLALAGVGIVQMLEYQCGAHLAAGRLVPIFSDHALDPLPLRVLYNDHQRHSLKVRAMVDFLQHIFRDGLPGEAVAQSSKVHETA
jgi:DNA-binding transcriptional LysR family regulator